MKIVTTTVPKKKKTKKLSFREQLKRINNELRQDDIDAKNFIGFFNGDKKVFSLYEDCYYGGKGNPKSNGLTVKEDVQPGQKSRKSNADENQFGDRINEIDEKEKTHTVVAEEISESPEPKESFETNVKKSIESLSKLIDESTKENPISLDFLTEDEKKILRKLPYLIKTPTAKKEEVAAAKKAEKAAVAEAKKAEKAAAAEAKKAEKAAAATAKKEISKQDGLFE